MQEAYETAPRPLCRCLEGPSEHQGITAASPSRQELTTLEGDIFRLLDTIGGNIQRGSTSQLYNYPGQLRPVYNLMASMLRQKLDGAWQAVASGTATATAIHLVREIVDFQQDDCVADAVDDVAAICSFLYAHLQLIHASQLSSILPFPAGPQASYPNLWLGLARTAGEALFLQPQLIQRLAQLFQDPPFLCAIMMEPELLGYQEVSGLLKGLCWQNGAMTVALITSVLSVVSRDQLQGGEDYALLGQHFVDILSSLKDSLYEQRIRHVINGSGNLISLLGCVKPLPRLFGWWCALILAQLNEKVSTELLETLSQHMPLVHQMRKCAAGVCNQGLVGGIDPGIRQMYQEVLESLTHFFVLALPGA